MFSVFIESFFDFGWFLIGPNAPPLIFLHFPVVMVELRSQFSVHQACYFGSLILGIVSLFPYDRKKLFSNYILIALLQSEIAQ